MLIKLPADPDLAGHSRPDGFDIGFTAEDGTALPYEREIFDAATGALVAWVRIPVLDGAADTTFDLVFGDPDAADQQAPDAVWDASYQAVLHFAREMRDSTANHNDGLAIGGPATGPGETGNGLQRVDLEDSAATGIGGNQADNTAPEAGATCDIRALRSPCSPDTCRARTGSTY